MKSLFTISFILLFSTFLFGTTYHTITIDGTNDFSSDETFSTTSSSTGYTAYLTWDQNNIYIGYNGADISSNSSTKWVLIYIDTDPQLTPTSGTGTTIGQLYNTQQPSLPFSANYHLRWKADNSYTNMGKWNGSSWDYGTGAGYWTGSYSQSGNFLELSIPLSDIGNPSQIYICTLMINEVNGGEWTYAGNPNDIFTDGYDPDYSHYLGYTLTSSVSPNNSSYEDNSLPVELSSFTTQVTNGQISLHWVTQSEVDALGYEIQRALAKGGSYETIASYRDHNELRAKGNYSAKTEYQYVDATAVPGVSYWYKLISHDLDGSQQTFGPISAKVELNNQGLQPVNGATPQAFSLEQNFPNPFNMSTEIRFHIPHTKEGAQNVRLTIYNRNGQKIRELVNASMGAGIYKIYWDGKDASGRVVPSGVYFYQLSTPQFVQARKMLLVK